MLRHVLKKVFRKAGYVVSLYDFKHDTVAVRMRLLKSLGVNLIFDVGANEGQFAGQMRVQGYTGRVVSFEPLSSAFERLCKRSAADPDWTSVNCALGSSDGTAEINLSRNSWSSSLLDMLPAHIESAPESEYIGKEIVRIRSLDSIIDDYFRPNDRLFVKIDTQGFGKKVLLGAEKSLDRIMAVQLEMSLIPLYKDEPLMGELLTYLQDKGYNLVHIEPEYFNPETGQHLQVNGLFLKKGIPPETNVMSEKSSVIK